MTELNTEPVAVVAPPTPPPPTPAPSREPATAELQAVAHTPGGIPVLPLALSGTNGAVGAVSAAALAGGGPVALAVAAGGAAVLGTAAAVRARRNAKNPRTAASRASSRTSNSPRLGRGLSPSRGTGGTGAGGRGRSAGPKLTSAAGKSGAGRGRHTSRHAAARSGGTIGADRAAGAGRGGGLGQVRALRRAGKEQAPTRAAARRQSTADRRAVADARRDARAADRARKAAGSKGLARRAAGWAGGKAASGTRALVNKARAARDRSTDTQVDAKRAQVRKAPARRRARWALLKSAARFHGRRLLAALAAGTVGLVGCLTTPLGRKLGWKWLMHPGRRLYRRLVKSAAEQRARRDEEIRRRRAEEEAAADRAVDEIGDRVARPAHLVPTAPTAAQEVVNVSGFKFEEAAAEMESAARTYEPDGNMEVLAMIDNLPVAMLSIANTFRILAERSDEEFAFEKEVAAAFDDIHRALLNAVDDSETLVPLFRNVHAADIARHEDPRNGTAAEKGWNV